MIRGSASVLLSLLVVACADDKDPAACPASPSCADTFAPSQPLTDDSNAEAAASSSATEPTPTSSATSDTSATSEDPSVTDPSSSPDDGLICAHIGGIGGVAELVTSFLGTVLADDRINAYFLSADIDFSSLGSCVVDQLGELTGCDGVTYGCAAMKAAHAGMGISAEDFNDFAEDFVTAWDTHKTDHPDVTQADFDTVLGVLGGMAPDIVEDADNNITVYQRIGRKPAIKALIGAPDLADSFVANVAADASINGFFFDTDFARFNTCLTRQVVGIDGPRTYGKEIDPPLATVDPGVSAANPCRDMSSAHADLTDDFNDGLGVEFADFGALVGQLVTAMTDAGVPMDDQNLILGVLGPLCPQIVTVDPGLCP